MPAARKPSRPVAPRGGTDTSIDDDLPALPMPPPDAGDLDVGPTAQEDDDLDLDDRDGGTDDASAGDLDIGDLEGEEPTAPPSDRVRAFSDDDDDFAALFESAADDRAEVSEDGPELAMDAFDDVLPASPDDGGAEGMVDGSEGELDEEALPDLDADAEGEVELDDMLRQLGFAGDAHEPWELAPGFGFDRALTDVVAQDGSVAAVGAALVVVGKKEVAPRVRSLAEAASSCAWLGPRTVFATSRGVHLTTGTGGDVLAIPMPGVEAVAVASGQVWALADRSLFLIDERAGSKRAVRGDVARIAAAASTLYVLTDDADAQLLALRGQDGDWEPHAVPSELLVHLAEGAALVVGAAGAVASIGPEIVLTYKPGGTGCSRFATSDAAAGAFCGDHPDAPLLLGGEGGSLILVDGERDPSEIARVPWRPRSIAWDGSRDLAFVAGDGGLAAFGPRVKH